MADHHAVVWRDDGLKARNFAFLAKEKRLTRCLIVGALQGWRR